MKKVQLEAGKGSFPEMVKLITEARSNANKDVDEILISLKELSFIKPYHVVIFACLIEELHENKILTTFVNENQSVKNYFTIIRFYEYWKPDFDRKSFNKVHIDTALSLWHISKGMTSFYADYAKKYFENNHFVGKDLDVLHINLSEVLNNIFDHSESAYSGYILTQLFPATKKIIISVCDLGIGIPNKINNFRKKRNEPNIPDHDAINKALVDGYTTRSTTGNKGLGLHTVKTSVASMNGTLIIIELDTRELEEKEKVIHEAFEL